MSFSLAHADQSQNVGGNYDGSCCLSSEVRKVELIWYSICLGSCDHDALGTDNALRLHGIPYVLGPLDQEQEDQIPRGSWNQLRRG